jgi:hypothetical protein
VVLIMGVRTSFISSVVPLISLITEFNLLIRTEIIIFSSVHKLQLT